MGLAGFRRGGGSGDVVGPVFAIVGVLGFAFKAILIKLAYAAMPIDAVTLLTLRMAYSAPFFALMAWWATRTTSATPLTRRDWLSIAWLGFIGYYLSSLVDFIGLQYVTAALERLMLYLYPTIVVVLSAIFLAQPITRRTVAALALSYGGIAIAVAHDIRFTGDPGAIALGSTLVFGSAAGYAIYLVGAGGIIARLGSSRFIAWAMLASAVFVFVQFALTRPLQALAQPMTIHALVLAMAVFCTVLPTWMIAESIRRIGASTASLIGSLGPLFTIGFGAVLLDEPVNALQLAGAGLVLWGVILVSRQAVRMRPDPGRNTAGPRTV